LPNIAILILAAGASQRMGKPKQLLKWKNTTLLGHAIETAQGTQSDVFVVLGAHFEEVNALINQYSIHILKNENWQSGLGSSIAFGVSHILKSKLNIDGILIMLADQPMISIQYLNSLINAYKVGESQIVASSYRNGNHGVPALFDKVYFHKLSKLNDDKGAKVILDKYAENVFVIDAKHLLSDIDSLQDYENLYRDEH